MDHQDLFLHSVPVEDLADDELQFFATGLACQARAAVAESKTVYDVDQWLGHWARAEKERQRRGMAVEHLFEMVC